MKKYLLGIFSTFLFSLPIQANTVDVRTKIKDIFTYGTYNGENKAFIGDVVIQVESTNESCDRGYWIHKDDAKENPSLVSFALSALHTSSTVRIGAETTRLWNGSIGKYCRIRFLSLSK